MHYILCFFLGAGRERANVVFLAKYIYWKIVEKVRVILDLDKKSQRQLGVHYHVSSKEPARALSWAM